jgi:hypothetical protein
MSDHKTAGQETYRHWQNKGCTVLTACKGMYQEQVVNLPDVDLCRRGTESDEKPGKFDIGVEVERRKRNRYHGIR